MDLDPHHWLWVYTNQPATPKKTGILAQVPLAPSANAMGAQEHI